MADATTDKSVSKDAGVDLRDGSLPPADVAFDYPLI
jgi:hypothetical protein